MPIEPVDHHPAVASAAAAQLARAEDLAQRGHYDEVLAALRSALDDDATLRARAAGSAAFEPFERDREFIALLDPLGQLAGARPASVRHVRRALAALLPVRAGLAELVIASDSVGLPACFEQPDGAVYVVLELIVYDPASPGEIQDIMRQEVDFLPPSALADGARLLAWLQGWCAALAHVFRAIDPETLGRCTPHALMGRDVLALARPQSADEFAAALLAPGRLGALLGAPER